MSRKIAFRAWNPLDKKMVLSDAVDTWPPSELRKLGWILMQFTGLHDKNGKEIWEGDILGHESWIENEKHDSPKDNFQPEIIDGIQLSGVNQNPYPIHRDFLWNKYRVVEYIVKEFNPTGFFSPFGYDSHACQPKNYEVLGNIYEHPNLLEKGTVDDK